MHNPLDVTKWSHKIFFFPFCVHLGWFTWNSKEQKAVCKAHNRLEQCKNEVRFLNILHFNHTPHPTIFQIFICVGVCVYVWSGVRLALDLRQSRMGLGKKWKKLGGSWRASRYKCLSLFGINASSWSLTFCCCLCRTSTLQTCITLQLRRMTTQITLFVWVTVTVMMWPFS